MVGVPRSIGPKARDNVLLREVIDFNLSAVAECTRCGHKKLLDDDILERLRQTHGREFRMADLTKILKCVKCQRFEAEILFRTGDYSNDWWPRRPFNRRN
ncbi:hypothetical protein G5V57_25785 [Nordella sp. HKS 07]|uniref:hypothetical protein n=1 Tax=Nordella sp. HKS 07 TaxID=2712222 RepID=UPI0013E15C51|nr:hypothetical protein [Nordella sp. HKS 07]QIG50844.1 hypothetical protein G5V57_25785 [Nordella sp. HKS 07]